MLYNGQNYEELQEYFDNIDKPNYYYKYKKQFIRFKKNKVNPWDKLEHCINKFVGKTVDECWSYFIKHLNNVEGYDLQWLYNNVFLERHIGYNYKNYKHQFKDGVIQYAYGGEPKQKFKTETKYYYNGKEYEKTSLVSSYQSDTKKVEKWIVISIRNFYLETRTWLILEIPKYISEELNIQKLIETELEYRNKIWIPNHPDYNERHPINVDRLIENFNWKTEISKNSYYNRANKQLEYELSKTGSEFLEWERREYKLKQRQYTIYYEQYEQLPITEVEVEIKEEKKEVVKNTKPEKKPKGYYKKHTLYLNTKKRYEEPEYKRVYSNYKLGIEPVIEKHNFTGNQWSDTRKKQFVKEQKEQRIDDLLTMERLGFDENSFITPTHIYREIRNDADRKRESVSNETD